MPFPRSNSPRCGGQPPFPVAEGTIVANHPGFRFTVKLHDGREVDAVLTRDARRDVGFLGPFPGLPARVSLRPPPKAHRVVWIGKRPAAPAG
jgi:hypothetical protein